MLYSSLANWFCRSVGKMEWVIGQQMFVNLRAKGPFGMAPPNSLANLSKHSCRIQVRSRLSSDQPGVFTAKLCQYSAPEYSYPNSVAYTAQTNQYFLSSTWETLQDWTVAKRSLISSSKSPCSSTKMGFPDACLASWRIEKCSANRFCQSWISKANLSS